MIVRCCTWITRLPLAEILIDPVVFGLADGKRIHFECQAGMSGPHDSVGRELAGGAEVTGKAQLATGAQVVGGVKTGIDVLLMGRTFGGVACQPTLCTPMTGFTSNPIIDMKAQTTIVCGNVVRMTIQADIRLMRVFQSKLAGDSAGFVIQQRQVGVGVAIML